MNARFIESCWIPLSYQKKQGTKGSYYQSKGKRGILPNRISMGIFAQRRESLKDIQKKNEINGQYRKAEEGLYMKLNQGKIHSSIWGFSKFPKFYGYGIIDERHGIYDLLILHSEDYLENIDIHIFRGLGKPEYIEQAFSYLQKEMKKSPN
jgi:hypothetical protein